MLRKIEALQAYARMFHHLSVDYLEPLLADEFHYSSQWVFEEITSKKQYLDYIRPKLESIRLTGERVWAEVGELQPYPMAIGLSGPCLVMAQGVKENLVATILCEVSDRHIQRIDMCMIPPPQTVKRSGEYPS